MFLTDPGMVAVIGHPDLFWLDGPLVWKDETYGRISIPAGFISDDASVPKFLDWVPFLDRQGLSRRPGLLHDGIYALGRQHGKSFADCVLEAACIAEGMSPWQAHVYYAGVDLFGGPSWRADAKEGIYGGIVSGDFISQAYFDAWIASGASIFNY